MNFTRTAVNVSCLVVALCGAAALGASRPVVRDIRYGSSADRTRVVLDMSGKARYSVRTLANPCRIVVDMPGCGASKTVRSTAVRDGVLDRIRVNRMKTGVQVVLDVPRKTDFSHFPLDASAGKPYRIVLDLARPSGTRRQMGSGRTSERVAREAPWDPSRVVVIDPGHGGDKPGTISKSGIVEKAAALKLARLVKAEIDRRPGYRAVLTRDGDYDVPWYRRVTLARENNADAFMSLHFNANPSTKMRGIEVYFLSMKGATDENAEAVAERENLMLEVGADSADFNDDLKSIIFDVSRSNAMHQSSLLAGEVASAVRRDAPIPFRKVKQANFIVLRGMVPSILVEGGYLSNRKDAARIGMDSYLQWLAKALSEGVVNFLEKSPTAETARDSR
jgi:N-acetylmuramoyl-L-alanine amidase